MSRPPEWLERYQARFSEMLRAPLDRSTGTLRARPEDYAAELCAEVLGARGLTGAQRLAAYNRQYWFRLFTALQTEQPLTTALLGPWTFNSLAARFLEKQLPRGHDLGRVADGFCDFLERELPIEGATLERDRRLVPRRAIVQAARIDDAFRCVFRAPEQKPFAPGAKDAERIPSARLCWSHAVRRVEEDWPLLELRREVRASERAIALPAPHAVPRHAMVCRTPEGFRVVPLAPLEATLMQLLETRPLGAALAELEQGITDDARASLAAQTRRWLAEGMRLGYWTGFEPGAP
jgi:hypothetical protein